MSNLEMISSYSLDSAVMFSFGLMKTFISFLSFVMIHSSFSSLLFNLHEFIYYLLWISSFISCGRTQDVV